MTKPLTWNDDDGRHTLRTETYEHDGDAARARFSAVNATPYDIAAALNAAGAEVVRKVLGELPLCALILPSLDATRRRAESAERDLATEHAEKCTVLDRLELALTERDEALAKLASAEAQRDEVYTLRAELAALRDERRFALVCALTTGYAAYCGPTAGKDAFARAEEMLPRLGAK